MSVKQRVGSEGLNAVINGYELIEMLVWLCER